MPYQDKEQERKYGRDQARRLRAEWIAENGPCTKCGTWEQLEIDHVDPSTKVSDNFFSSMSKARRAVELAKCQVLCHDCHQEKSMQERSARHPLVHGTRAGYQKGCRCEPCKVADRQYLNHYRKVHGRKS